jgi:hypothetical protein
MNGTHQFLVYADGANFLGESINTIRRNADALLRASKEVSLEANAENSMQNAG